MSTQPNRSPRPQQGMALISGLLLLMVMTIIGISMFRSYGMQTRIAGNTRDKHRALLAAEAAQAYAEWWLSSNGGINATLGSACSTPVVTDLTKVHVCSNALPMTGGATTAPAAAATVPWGGSSPVGFQYTPPNGFSTTGSDPYAQSPVFYITYLNNQYIKSGSGAGTQIYNYRVDGAGAGGTANTVAEVESSYSVAVTYTISSQRRKFYSLTGP